MAFPQVVFITNCPAASIDATFSAALPVFVSVTFCGGLVVLTACWLNKSMVLGVNETTPVFSMTTISL